MHVTEAHLDFYKEQGYVIIEGGLSDADLAPIIEDHVHIVDEIARDLYERARSPTSTGESRLRGDWRACRPSAVRLSSVPTSALLAVATPSIFCATRVWWI